MPDFLPVADDPRHQNPDFHAGYLKGLQGGAMFLDQMATVSAKLWGDRDDPDDLMRQAAARSWAECLRILGKADES